ncbi:ERBB-3 binding protein 1 [Rhynchospora pubera]|uniref:ERBB-3 binding protein 1 n=1 Tax=Rhynchospora pubera TaxID=906938 RepID=A0AAV8ECK3_9POAL|nr:ERBB-3 binding protein 1 [Rhynchospora pubera]
MGVSHELSKLARGTKKQIEESQISFDIKIVNKALQLVISECKPKAKIVNICENGDNFISKLGIRMRKRRSGKVWLSQHACLDMGSHIDGFIAVVAHTHVIQSGPVTGRAADVLASANTDLSGLERMCSERHQLKQFVIDGNKAILSVSNPETRVDDAEFEENEVYYIDIASSTGEGKMHWEWRGIMMLSQD